MILEYGGNGTTEKLLGLWDQLCRLPGPLERERAEQLRQRAREELRSLDEGTLVDLGMRLGLDHAHLLDLGLLRVALNPFYPWACGAPLAVSDVALHRSLTSARAAGARREIRGATVRLQRALGGRNRPQAFAALHDLRSSVQLLTLHSWRDELLDAVSFFASILINPQGIMPPFLVLRVAQDLGWIIRLRCPSCGLVLGPRGRCRVHKLQRRYAVWH